MRRIRLWIIAAIVLLNVAVGIGVDWRWSSLFFSTGLFISLIPMVRLIEAPGDELSVFPVISLIYGVYFCLFGLIPFEPFYRVAGVSEHSLFLASILGCIGIACLNLGYRYGSLRSQSKVDIERVDFGPKAGNRIAIMGIIGTLGWVANFVSQVPVGAQSILNLISELLVFAFAGLFYLQLKGRTSRSLLVLNWCFFFPVIVFTSLATSLLYPMLRVMLLAFVVFMLVRRRVPWRTIGVMAIVILPVFLLKIEFRKLEQASNKQKFTGITQMAQRVQLYGVVAKNIATSLDSEVIREGYDATASRFDLSHTFGFIIDYTPSEIPYLMGASYQALFWKLIPRALYPDKPVENWGNELGHRFGWLAPDDDDTSVNMPQLIELYLNFGPVGVPIGMGLIGLLYAGLIRLLYRDRTQVQGLVTIFLMSTLFNVESNFSLVFGGLIYSIPLFILIIRFVLKPTLEPEPVGTQPPGA